MSDELNLEELAKALKKSRDEFDIATACLATGLKEIHERIERIERWIAESQKSLQES